MTPRFFWGYPIAEQKKERDAIKKGGQCDISIGGIKTLSII
jgi:hypothetical protein